MEQFIIRPDAAEKGECKGLLWTPRSRKGIPFLGAGDLIVKIDRALRSQAERRKRSPGVGDSFPASVFREQTRPFFLLEIFYMEHGGWQGRLWGPGCPGECFKSVAELMERLESCGKQKSGGKRRRKRM